MVATDMFIRFQNSHIFPLTKIKFPLQRNAKWQVKSDNFQQIFRLHLEECFSLTYDNPVKSIKTVSQTLFI